jgi:uroporphyrin-III C-methyltransferase
VSEATPPKDPEQVPAPVESVEAKPLSAPAASSQAKPSGNGLALLALLLGAAGAAAGGWGLWQLQGLQQRDQHQLEQLEQVQQSVRQTQALGQATKALEQRVQQLPAAAELEEQRRLLSQLQGDQQLLNQRLESVLGASRQDWRLAEAEHLLRLASLRLSALQDISSAEALVAAADEIVRNQNDPAAFAAREQLVKSLEALRTTFDPDRTGLFLQLGALRDQAAALNPLTPGYAPDGGVLGELAASEPTSWWAEWLKTMSHYVRLDFNAAEDIRPLLAGQGLGQVRLALAMAFEQAQWAALHGHTEVYQQALRQASEVLDAHFNAENPDSRALAARIAELRQRPIEVKVPDLSDSLEALQAYIARKQSAREALRVDEGEQEARP